MIFRCFTLAFCLVLLLAMHPRPKKDGVTLPVKGVPARFTRIKPANPTQGSITDVLRFVPKLNQEDAEDLREMTEYAYQMFKGRFDGICQLKQYQTHLEFLINDVFKTFPILALRRLLFYMQTTLISKNKVDWVKSIHTKYVEAMWDLSITNRTKTLSNRGLSIIDFQPIVTKYEMSFEMFLAEWQTDRTQFHSRIALLFPRFSNIDETIDFVSQGLYLQYKSIKDGDKMIRDTVREYRQNDALQLLGNMRDKLHIIRFLARKLLQVKKLDKKDRAGKLNGLLELYHLMQPMRIKDNEGAVGKFMKNFDIQVPGSPEWHYVRYRLKNFYQMSVEIPNRDNFTTMIVTIFDLLESQIQNAIANHVPGALAKYIGYLVCGSTPDQLYLYWMMKKVNWDSSMSVLFSLQSSENTIEKVIDNKTYEGLCESHIKQYDFVELLRLSSDEWKELVSKSFTGCTTSKVPVSNLIMLQPDKRKAKPPKSLPLKQSEEIQSAPVSVPVKESTDEPPVEEKIPAEEPKTANETPDEIGITKPPIKAIPQRPTVDLQALVASSKETYQIDAEDNSEEIAMYMAQFEKDLMFHKETTMNLNKGEFDMATSIDSNISISNQIVEFGHCQVVTMRTEDFLTIPVAYALYHANKANETHWEAQHDRSAKYQWLFDSNVIIDNDTYLFLCQVFGLLPGRSHLTFNDFLHTMFALTYASAPESDKQNHKNRTVFRFYHHFIIDGKCCIPPAVGVHPEHKSSDFNHAQVSKVLEYAGAFPFFFRKLYKH